MENYPSNSQRPKKQSPQRPPEAKKIARVTTGTVTQRKTPIGKRFTNVFVGGDAKSVWNYIAFDILVPAAKDMVADAISSGIDQMLFGNDPQRWGGRGRRRPGPGPAGIMNYGGVQQVNYQNPQQRGGPTGRPMSRQGRGSHNFNEIVLETRADAHVVLDQMYSLLSTYEQVTVSELYELVGVTANFTDNKWGWTNLQGAGVAAVRGGYLLDLPQPVALD